MGILAVVLLLAALTATACTAPPAWSERRDIAVEAASGGLAAIGSPPAPRAPRDLMICVVDLRGEARCHHRGGALRSRARAGTATCAGAELPLRSRCEGAGGCVFRGVPVPSGAFGLLVVELRPPVLGVPRHVVVDAAAVAGSPRTRDADVAPLRGAVGALARCLAAGGAPDTALLRVDRHTCEDGFCGLRRTRFKLGRPAWEPDRPRREDA